MAGLLDPLGDRPRHLVQELLGDLTARQSRHMLLDDGRQLWNLGRHVPSEVHPGLGHVRDPLGDGAVSPWSAPVH
ncbi:MAG: hypothetical protein ACYCYK_08490 [Candidatus Dormibacteria bacterium]